MVVKIVITFVKFSNAISSIMINSGINYTV